MSVAARWAGWSRRSRNTPGPLQAASLAGVPFLRQSFGDSSRLLIEFAFGADLTADPDSWQWTDVTADVMFAGNGVTISPMGRGDETSKSQPAGCKFKLYNATGDYSTGPASKFFPYVRRNTPTRVKVTLDGVTWYIRFQGYANGFTPAWDTSGRVATVSVSASGVLRRLQQGDSPLNSPLWRATAALSPVAWWPLEEESSATQGESGVTGGTPFTVTSGTASFGAFTDAPGAVRAPELIGAKLGAALPTTSAGGWAVHFAIRAEASGASPLIVALKWDTVNGDQWVFYMTEVGLNVQVGYGTAGGADPPQVGALVNLFDGEWHSILAYVRPASGSTTTVTLYLDGVNTASNTGNPYTFSELTGTLSFPDETIFTTTDVESFSLSHLAFFEAASAPTGLGNATAGHAGETVTERLTRLCDEFSVPLSITGTADTTMGVQSTGTFTGLLEECEVAEDGVLFDGQGPGLSYTTRSSRYNAAAAITADMSTTPPPIAAPFAPVDDDQRNRNLVKVTRKGGSSAVYEDAAGPLGTAAIGIYDTSITVNHEEDGGQGFRASHEVKKGTVEGLRYPDLNLDLVGAPAIAPSWLAAGVSSRATVTNVTSRATQHPTSTVDLVLEGWSEQLSPFTWTASGNCSPFAPWHVAVIEGAGDTAWRIDSDASTLAAAAAPGATSLTVTVTDGIGWSTSAGDYPQTVSVGGAPVTVTAVSALAGGQQTFTVSPIQYQLAAGRPVSLWQPPKIAL